MKVLYYNLIATIVAISFFGASFSVQALESLEILDIQTEIKGVDVTITWRTNQAASTRIDYGESIQYDRFLTSGSKDSTDHTLTLYNLKEKQRYHFSVTSKTRDSKVMSFDGIFLTKEKADDGIAPRISSVRTIYVSATSATIAWITDKPSTSTVYFGKTEHLGGGANGPGNTNEHQVTLRGLTVGAKYHYTVSSTDKFGNRGNYGTLSFRTVPTHIDEAKPLIISSVRPLNSNSELISHDTATITWNTSIPTTNTVYYGTHPTVHNHAVHTRGLSTSFHEITIPKLQPDTLYYFHIYARDVLNRGTNSETHSFKTNSAPKINSGEKDVKVLGYTTTAFTPASAAYRAFKTNPVYALRNGYKILIATPQSLQIYGIKWTDIKEVDLVNIQGIPQAKLIKSSTSPTVYYIFERESGNMKLAIPNERIFQSYKGNIWSNVITVNSIDIDYYPDVNLIRGSSGDKVYLLKEGRKYAFPSMNNLILRGYKWENIVEINDVQLNHYPTGAPLH